MLTIDLKHLLNQTQLRIKIEDAEPKIYAIKGPSGIGKTTILNMLAGLRKPDQALISINNHTLTDTINHIDVKIQNRNIGYLFQDYQLFPHMNVFQNITFMAGPSDHIDTLITQLNIEHLKTKFPIRLSGGESQRVALARTLSTKPDLILLDEPFSSLDDTTKEESISLVKRIFKLWQIPIIFVTHSNYEAARLAHEVINIE
ncbi:MULTISPECIES: ATP-binding cassette domain-containing protein [Staphylococcus]|jgi:molybdate transport system ATP-binding protein|uniref:ATP-binding cassette domain-containing protein n=1 Tax=Staphylococcus nepalensis TaxID=214473 RepID=A0ABS3L0L8_9STAP|nr:MULTISPECIES: ATP-binding cassette domain-containing protein [Staphylococcus]MBO1205794.1 ATP-binding cassette domain-containing protein [Staphylococcus nepalensis]MBO1212821.1 ATP-binding cassette domain-containing protein [Staphylococcus nepalensis]MBO1215733.1 ATP-binding cassette domain-containing protein [Staphylococcus nepalensis]MBO1221258.1 ATP-binding cassette domain-containing protein [Staphylococcus nepalensis]MBO1227104.1 ATP-binding cassette domain-containing protein [Staphyloc